MGPARHNIAQAARAEVEEETFAVAQFHHDGGARLVARGRHRRTADKRDAHLVVTQFLHAWEEGVGVRHRRRWPVVRRQRDAGVRTTAIGVLDRAHPGHVFRGFRGRGDSHRCGGRRRGRGQAPERVASVHCRLIGGMATCGLPFPGFGSDIALSSIVTVAGCQHPSSFACDA
jgi:hypothetical protein